jgi:peptidoglycan/LPS O-acetylase OafA/YrhL
MLHGAIPEELLPDAARSILPPAWSISLEWQFYLLAPLLLAGTAFRRFTVIALIAAVGIVSTPAVIKELTGLTFEPAFFPLSANWFALGMGSYLIVRDHLDRPIPPASSIVVAGGLFLITGSYVVAAWALIVGALLDDKPVRAILESRVLLWLGTISYSIYLTHMIVITPVRKIVVQRWIGADFGTFEHLAFSSFISVPLTIVASYLMWRLIERPGMQAGRWCADRIAARRRSSGAIIADA